MSTVAQAPMREQEDIVFPELPLIDCHHHLWVQPGHRYLIEEFSADVRSGHRVEATVYIECNVMYRDSGPAHMRCVGEAEFAAGQAAMSDSGQYGPTRIAAAFVGSVDLQLGARVDEVLEAMRLASGGRLRGIRGNAAWDQDPKVNTGVRPFGPPGLLMDPRFREGFAALDRHKLSYDAWQYHPQLGDVCSLADAFPHTTIVVDHCGGLLGIQGYANEGNFSHWRSQMAQLALRPNVTMKLGGMSAKRCGFDFAARPTPPTAQELARCWKPYTDACIELFGVDRCMYEGNFPADRTGGNFRTVWNALKLTAAGCSEEEKNALFSGTAAKTYRIQPPLHVKASQKPADFPTTV